MHRMQKRCAAFTLVELLVVIGIIGIIAGIMFSALSKARKGSDRLRCLAALQQIGRAFDSYASDNHGYWPIARIVYSGPNGEVREKRWYDLIGRYVNGNRDVNADGTSAPSDTQDTIASLQDCNKILWGCPSWDRVNYGPLGSLTNTFLIDAPGYAMNIYTFAPRSQNSTVNGYRPLAFRADSPPNPDHATGGWFFKATAWTRPSERALVFDNNAFDCLVKTPFPAKFPTVPSGLKFSIDFNRHGVTRIGNAPTQPSLNMLFCDGHATLVSAKEAYQAIQFGP